jgi:hypothetical protein
MKPYASSRAPGGARAAATRLAARRLFSDIPVCAHSAFLALNPGPKRCKLVTAKRNI